MSGSAEPSTFLSRRRLLAGTGAALAGAAGLTALGISGVHGSVTRGFDEVYLGRRIQGKPLAAGGHDGHDGWMITVDGRELHAMRNADDTWISVINHYKPQPSPLALARAAVTDLEGASLTPVAL